MTQRKLIHLHPILFLCFLSKRIVFRLKNDKKNYHYLQVTEVKDSWRDNLKTIKQQQQKTSILGFKWLFVSWSVQFKFKKYMHPWKFGWKVTGRAGGRKFRKVSDVIIFQFKTCLKDI